jgi:type I restriction enzyme S subunit
VKALKEQVRGGIKTEIKAKDFLPIQIALPEIKEQQKINNHFNSFEQELADLNTEQENQSSYLSQLRQSILQEAIEGKLTADWRKKNPVKKGDPNTDASALLDKIKAEKQKLIAAGKLKKEKPLAPIKPEEIPFDLPKGWVWCRLGEITECMTYGTSQSCSYDINQNTKVLRIPNISSGYISADDLKYTNLTESEREELFLREGDVLVIRSNGSCNIVGLGVFVPNTFAGYCYAGYLIRLRFKFIVLGQYVSIIFATKLIRDQIENPLRTTVGINNINSQELSNLLFPLRPLAEQKAIVERVDRLLGMVNELQQQVKDRQTQAEQLMQSVLREAFEQN